MVYQDPSSSALKSCEPNASALALSDCLAARIRIK